MAIIAKDTSRDFIPAPEGLHTARLVEVEDRGEQRSELYGTTRHTVRFIFQLEATMPETGHAYTVSCFRTLSLSDNSKLKPFLESWMGRRLTAAELEHGIDLETFVNHVALLQVMHNERKGTIYADVMNILPVPPGTAYHFPPYVRTGGEIIRDELTRGSGAAVVPAGTIETTASTAAAITEPTGGRIHAPGEPLTAGRVQVLGTAVYGREWPTRRVVLLNELGLPVDLAAHTPEQLATFYHYLLALQEEADERKAAA